MNKILLFFFGIILIFLFSIINPKYFFPSDILYYLPSYSAEKWERPHNSLLADPVFQFEPWRMYAKGRILKGEIPFWNNKNGSGAPFLANPQTALIYPLNLLYYFFPAKVAFWVIPLLKFYLFFWFVYLYLRKIGLNGKVSILGSLVAIFAGFPMVWILWPHTNVFILFPLILLLIERINDFKQSHHRFYLLLAIAVFIGVLGGHPQTLFHLLIISMLYAFLRLKEKAKLFAILASIVVGLLLGSFQLIPFIEYLLHSNAFQVRFGESYNPQLPLWGIGMNFIPFLLGAPHQEFYKQLSSSANFQEMIGGYVGASIILTVIFGIFLIKKASIYKIWAIITIVCFILAYSIWPFSLINSFPGLTAIANTRLLGFGGFGLVILFSITLQGLLKVNPKLSKKWWIIVGMFSGIGFLSIFIIRTGGYFIRDEKIADFTKFLSNHLALTFITILSYLIVLFISIYHKKIPQLISFSLIGLLLLSQSALLFWNYNSITGKDEYYPKIELVKILQSLPRGKIIEVGNMLFPPNINLVYDLYHVKNDDALEVNTYKRNFDILFPDRNQWNNPNEVNKESLKKLGIRYIISDYSINLRKQNIQTDHKKIIPLHKTTTLSIPFTSQGQYIKQVRLLTANYNRQNNCKIEVSLIKGKEALAKNILLCRDVRDNMFYSAKLEASLLPNESYAIQLENSSNRQEDFIGFWGNESNIPYADVLYENTNESYKLLWSDKSIYLWEAPDAREIIFNPSYKIITQTPEKVSLEYNSEKPEPFEIKRINYPGWVASIDNENVQLSKNDLFISFHTPPGHHMLSIQYVPWTFYLGSFISFITSAVCLVFICRQEMQEKWWTKFNKNLNTMRGKVNKQIPWWQHVYFLLVATIFSALVFALLTFLFPLHFSMPQTTAINWYTVHQYPRQLEYFYFYFGFLFVVGLSSLLWAIWIWKKIK